MKTKFKVGDKVKVVRGPWSIVTKGNDKYDRSGYDIVWHDDDPSVGQVGIIIDAHKTQGIDNYSLHYPNGFGGKMAWFSNKDLELIENED